jgi:ssRNA-specific RNase YbeY (16S rRNA maturation enzyme)
MTYLCTGISKKRGTDKATSCLTAPIRCLNEMEEISILGGFLICQENITK